MHLFVHVTDELDVSTATAAQLIALMTAMLLLAAASVLWLVTVAVALQGLAWGARGPLTSALRAEYFGPASFGKIMGFSSLIIMSGMMFGPLIAGLVYDSTGTYRPAFIGLAAAAGLGSLCFVFATRPRSPTATR